MNGRRTLFMILFLAISAAAFASCANNDEIERLQASNGELRRENHQLQQELRKMKEVQERLDFLSAKMEGVQARIITNLGNIELEFFPDLAPIHVFNFITRAESGFYDGTKFHRVIPNFMIQGGDPNTRGDNRRIYGQGGPLVMIPHEFNEMSHARGILSMARVSDVSAGAGSQFFIMHGESPSLDGQYTVFGSVTSGMEVVDAIAGTETSRQYRDQPVEDIIIKEIKVFR